MFGSDRTQLRQTFYDAWSKRRAGEMMTPLEEMISEVVAMHPEYHTQLDNPDLGLDRDYLPEDGESNPFLHMAMHISLVEQVGTDRPSGIRSLYQQLCQKLGDEHKAEHQLMECLARALWEAQANQRIPDDGAYLECIRRLVG
jgi:hypothetical protein